MKSIKSKRILITGGAGFIGSNLVKSCLEFGASVTVLDDLSTGFLHNLKEFENNPNFFFIQGDITELETCLKATINKDIVFHLAALGSVPRSIDTPMATHNVNVNGFANILWAAKENHVTRLIFSSSSSIYGDDENMPKTESKIGNPLSPYAVSKRTNELYAHTFNDHYGMDIIGLRYFNVFGPKQNIAGPYAAVIPIFIQNLLNNKQCRINGDGSISRDFTYVQNVVNANILAGTTTETKAFGKIFNIAMGDSISLTQLYNAIESNINSGLEPIYGEPRKGDILHSLANIDMAKELLNFAPAFEFKDAIQQTVDWYKTNS